MGTPLIVCIGNVARGDDGVAHEVCRLLEARGSLSGASLVAAPDLDIAMASQVAEAQVLVLVDAERRETPPVVIRPLEAVSPGSPTGHGIDAPGLLALSSALYGRAPAATLVSVAAPCMGHSTELSNAAREAAHEAADAVMRLLSGSGA